MRFIRCTEPIIGTSSILRSLAWIYSHNSFSIEYKPNSFTSNKISFLGCCLIICLHNSEPIEPPAPVTITTLFAILAAISSGFGSTESRPSRSSISTSLNSESLALPPTISAIPGIDSICIAKGSNCASTSLRRERLSLGIASNILPMLRLLIRVCISLNAYTGTPWIIEPCFVTSSSINARTWYSGPASSAVANCLPDDPAP